MVLFSIILTQSTHWISVQPWQWESQIFKRKLIGLLLTAIGNSTIKSQIWSDNVSFGTGAFTLILAPKMPSLWAHLVFGNILCKWREESLLFSPVMSSELFHFYIHLFGACAAPRLASSPHRNSVFRWISPLTHFRVIFLFASASALWRAVHGAEHKLCMGLWSCMGKWLCSHSLTCLAYFPHAGLSSVHREESAVG